MQVSKKINEVVVVEGYHDLDAVKKVFPTVDVVITNGSEISIETLNELKVLNEKRGLILLLDPDYPGEKIRKEINNHVGNTKHAYIRKELCINKKGTKVGIEHAPLQEIEKALNKAISMDYGANEITVQDLYKIGLIGNQNSKSKRKKLSDYLNIGEANGKTLCKKLNMFNISLNQIKDLIKE